MPVLVPERSNTRAADRVVATLRTRRSAEVSGGLAAVVAAVVLFSRFSINSALSRDEAIYAYGGVRLAHGTPPYVSIFDPKTPLATLIAGLAAAIGRVIGRDQLLMIRLTFFACAVLCVLAVYLLVLKLWSSVVGGVVAAIVFASFTGFAQDALPGPDAKTPGILFAVLAMWLAVRRNSFWAGVAGSCAFLVWQPLIIYPALAVAGAAVATDPKRWRASATAAAGVATPLVITLGYFTAAGALGDFLESAFRFPATGVERGHESVGHRIDHIAEVVNHYYGFSGGLFWAGLALLGLVGAARVVAAGSERRRVWRDPLLLIVIVSLLAELGYAASDFQSYPDLYPLLPYAAVGFGGAVALGLRRLPTSAVTVALGATMAATLALTLYSAVLFSDERSNNSILRRERATACALNQIIVPGTPMWSLGDPAPLVVTGRRNPDRFIYLGTGVSAWKVGHTDGGFTGWTNQIEQSRASVVISQRWNGPLRFAMARWLQQHGYRRGYVGPWRVFVTTRARVRATLAGLAITTTPMRWPQTADGGTYRRQNCGVG